MPKRLNHVEFVHPPGERHLVRALFDLLEIGILEMSDGEIVIGVLDPASFDADANDNYLAGREVRPEQWAFDRALAAVLQGSELSASYRGYQRLLADKPQWGTHFGINLGTVERWEAAIAKVREVDSTAPELAGRVKLLKVFRPEERDDGFPLHQAFLWTDVIASGSLALGQRIELATAVA
jgi:hypothetical protein